MSNYKLIIHDSDSYNLSIKLADMSLTSMFVYRASCLDMSFVYSYVYLEDISDEDWLAIKLSVDVRLWEKLSE